MSDQHEVLYDAAGRWRRWEPAPLDEPETGTAEDTGASGVTEDTGPSLPDPEEVLAEIQRLRETAEARGHAEGFAAGHEQGMTAGLTEGREEGFREGREAGYAEGYAHGQEEAGKEAQALRDAAQAVSDAIEKIEEEMGQALLSLATRIAEQVLRSTLDTQPERILGLIHDVLHVDGSQQEILKLQLNPADVELVEKYLESDGSVGRWSIQSDPSIERGGCIAVTALGTIDATLQTRWQRVVSALGVKD